MFNSFNVFIMPDSRTHQSRWDESPARSLAPGALQSLPCSQAPFYLPITGASFVVDDPSFRLRRDHFMEPIKALLSLTAMTDEELAPGRSGSIQ